MGVSGFIRLTRVIPVTQEVPEHSRGLAHPSRSRWIGGTAQSLRSAQTRTSSIRNDPVHTTTRSSIVGRVGNGIGGALTKVPGFPKQVQRRSSPGCGTRSYVRQVLSEASTPARPRRTPTRGATRTSRSPTACTSSRTATSSTRGASPSSRLPDVSP